jgi:hypothetical protein
VGGEATGKFKEILRIENYYYSVDNLFGIGTVGGEPISFGIGNKM